MPAGTSYYTFFLCGHDWSPGFARLAPWIERLLDALSLRRRATLHLATAPGTPARTPARMAPFDARALAAARADLAIVSVPAVAPQFEFFAHLEGVRRRFTPEYVRWLDPEQPEQAHEPDALRICSIGVAPGLLGRKRDEVVGIVESMFLDLGCVYGFAHGTPHLVTGAYAALDSASPPLRVVDVDFRTSIHALCDHNWLSSGHVARLADLDALLRLGPATVRPIHDAAAALCALYVRAQGASAAAGVELRRQCAMLLPAPAPRRSATLVVGPREAARMGRDALENCFPGTVASVRPGGHVEVFDLERPAHADSLGFTRALERVYRGTRADARGSASEALVEFGSPLHPQHVYYRFGPGGGDEDVAKIRTGRVTNPAAVTLRLIGRRPEDARAAVKALEAWADRVKAAPDTFGVVRVRRPAEAQARGTAHYAEAVLDLTRLREEAFALLAVILDEANARRCVVAYAIVGDIP